MGPSCQYVWQCGNLEIKVAHYMIVRDGLVCPRMHLLTTLQGGKKSVPSFFDWVYKIGPRPS